MNFRLQIATLEMTFISNNLLDMAFVIFDTETTGLNPLLGDRIIEIGAVRVVNGVITDETFEALINPHRIVPTEAINIHGITNEMLKTAPDAAQVIPEFLKFIGDDTLVAHNAEFDMGFLENELKLLNLGVSLPSSLCTVKLAKIKFPDLPRYNLDALSKHLGMTIERRHRALDDVLATAELFTYVHEQAPTLF
ncbi:MAG: 3'-5' exonuclease [Candidatus Gracilibacteria bacterium]|nr:3'-5' exonuclease [Candidatus Gracilibacteria bacterium]